MKKDFIFIAIILVLSFLYLRTCGPDKVEPGPEDFILFKTDTVKTQGKTDTVFLSGKTRRIVDSFPVFVEVRVDEKTNDTVKTYFKEFSDSLISGSIKSEVVGLLLSSELQYVPKFPKYITRVDTVKILEQKTKPVNNYGLYYGVVLGGSKTSFSAAPSLMLKTPRKLYFTAGYDLINKTVNLGAFSVINSPFSRKR
jgi:hypothetical protein